MRRGGEDVEIVSTGCRSPSVLHPWMLLLHMQETALWIHRLGPLSSRGGVQISWMLLLHMQETVFVDSPSVLCPLEGGPRHIGTSLTVSSLWHCLGHSQASLQCHFSRCKVGSLKGLRVRIVLVDAFTDLMRCRK